MAFYPETARTAKLTISMAMQALSRLGAVLPTLPPKLGAIVNRGARKLYDGAVAFGLWAQRTCREGET